MERRYEEYIVVLFELILAFAFKLPVGIID